MRQAASAHSSGVLVPSLFLFAIAGCSKAPNSHSGVSVVPLRSHYIRRTNADAVVVFVHGIFGDAKSTWTNDTTHAYWPELLTKDAVFKDADIYVHAFSSPYLSTSYTIDELVENMRLVFDNDEVFEKHKYVVFVCHSMGGLVTRGYLRRYQDRARKVRLIYFFATPTSGSDVTRLAEVLSNNPQIKGMLPPGAGEYVTILQRDWRALPVHVLSRCAYEKRATYGVHIVDETSATGLCDGPVNPIDADHIQIVKPKDAGDLPYIALREAFQGIDTALSAPDTVPSPTVTTGAQIATRALAVSCGKQTDGNEQIGLPVALKPEQRLVDAVVSLQKVTNLKEQAVELTGRTESAASVRYRLVGLDASASGTCAGERRQGRW